MKRLLLYFSYIGTNYRGLQRKASACQTKTIPDFETVQGVLEFGIKKCLQIDQAILHTSSRTDTKVHACESTAVLDLDIISQFKKKPYSPERICQSLNLFLEKNECDIRVARIVEVPGNFASRHAYSRVYEFRIAILNGEPHTICTPLRLSSATNIKEINRCEVVTQPFNLKSVQEACRLFIGTWDFSTFMKSSREIVPAPKRIKTIRRFSITPEIIPESDWDNLYTSCRAPPYHIYNFTVEGSGFLRRQVRRMVGALVGVGRGTIGAEEILWMLQNPNEKNWNPKVSSLGPNGLFLKKINYTEMDILRGYLS